MIKIIQNIIGRKTGQGTPIPGQEQDMTLNNAGGYTFELNLWEQLQRFLILGSEGGSYYASERKMTFDNVRVVERCLKEDGLRLVAEVVALSQNGRAPRQDPAILALAMACAAEQEAVRQAALKALPKVLRTGTHLFQFAEAVEKFRGWGRGLRHAVGNWYTDGPLDRLILQALKYPGRQVAGPGSRWSHRDLLRLAHPKTEEADRSALFAAIVGKEKPGQTTITGHKTLAQWDAAQDLAQAAIAKTITAKQVAEAILAHRLPREVIPTEFLNDAVVWDALLQDMPATAMIRNLGKMSAVGLLTPGSEAEFQVIKQLSNTERLAAARLHPLQLLMAQVTYAYGKGLKGSLFWEPLPRVTQALEAAFYQAFAWTEAAHKRLMLAVDVSGSMGWGTVAGTTLSPRVAATAMALVTAVREPEVDCRVFSNNLSPAPFKKGDRLDQALKATDCLPMDMTDCAAPIMAALKQRQEVDGFVIYTDNETWFGDVHPMDALRRYRNEMGIPAKLIVVGLTATSFTIADPKDGGALDVVGFDASAPAIMTDFLRS